LTNYNQLFFLHSTVIGQFLTLTASSTTATAHCRPCMSAQWAIALLDASNEFLSRCSAHARKVTRLTTLIIGLVEVLVLAFLTSSLLALRMSRYRWCGVTGAIIDYRWFNRAWTIIWCRGQCARRLVVVPRMTLNVWCK